MNTFLEKIMELGAMEDRACSDTEIKLIKNEAEELYNNHLAELKVLNIDDVSKCEHKETKISGGNGFAFKVVCKDCGETV